MGKLTEAIQKTKRITLVSHLNPDGDAVGSLAALSLAMEQVGKEVEPILVSGLPSVFNFLFPHTQPKREFVYRPESELCLVLDASDSSRTGSSEAIKTYATQGRLGAIDHHLPGDLNRLTDLSLFDPSASSTAELVYRLLVELEIRFTPAIATAILTGIYTDTGGFQHPNTSPAVMELAAELMRRGGRLDIITHQITHGKSVAGLKLLGIALKRIQLTRKGQFAVSVLTHQDISECGAGSDDLAGIIGELNSLPNVQIVLLLAEQEEGQIRGIIRSGNNNQTNIGLLGRILGGGGHPRAAGFSLPGRLKWNQAKEQWRILTPSSSDASISTVAEKKKKG